MDAASKPVIGINSEFLRPKHGPAHTVLAAGYYDALVKAGARPVVLPPVDDLDLVPWEMLDGLVFCGGADLDPRRDGFMLHTWTRPMDARRETFDRALMRRVVDRRMPVLAIGVGAQLLNVVMGGNLFLHIPEDLPRALPHSDPMDPCHRHAVIVEPGSLMERVYGCDLETRVNSQHHMAIDEVAPGFAVTARAPDGVTEAIESTSADWLAVGAQWHPEAPASAFDAVVFVEWIAAVRERIGGPEPEPESGPPGPGWIRAVQLAELCGVSRERLAEMRVAGHGPGGAAQDRRGWWWYREDAARQWIAEHGQRRRSA